MKCIAIETELRVIDPVKQKELLYEEALVIWDLTMQGILRESHFKKDVYEAVLIFESETVEAVHSALNRLPLVREGYISFEVFALRPYPGLSRLFA